MEEVQHLRQEIQNLHCVLQRGGSRLRNDVVVESVQNSGEHSSFPVPNSFYSDQNEESDGVTLDLGTWNLGNS